MQLIGAGKISGGHVCAEGGPRFVPLSSHLPFARALAAKRAGAPPGAGAALVSTRRGTAPAADNGRRLLFAGVFAFLALALAAIGIGTHVMFETSGTPAHAAVPSDTELLLEIPSLHRALARLGSLHDSEAKPPEGRLIDDVTSVLSTSFGIARPRATALVLSASSLGIAARKLATRPEGGLLLTFDAAAPVNSLLTSRRFRYAGLVARNGRVYRLAKASDVGGALGARRLLSNLTLSPDRADLVWFETSRVLFIGSASYAVGLARSLALDAPSLAQNPGFQRAERVSLATKDAFAYLDLARFNPHADAGVARLIGDSFAKAEPVIESLELVPYGVRAHAVVRVGAGGARVVGTPVVPTSPLPLTVMDRLPTETFAYVAGVSNDAVSPANLLQLLEQASASADRGSELQVQASLGQAEEQLHLALADVLGAFGDQAALAVLSAGALPLERDAPGPLSSKFAVVYLQSVSDEASARALVARLATRTLPRLDRAQVRADAEGLAVFPDGNALGLSAQLRLAGGNLCFAIGRVALVQRSLQAFITGEGTLAASPAHKAVRALLPGSAQLFAWVDAGRMASRLLRSPSVAERAGELGLGNVESAWAVPERVDAALTVSKQRRGDADEYAIDTLNMPLFAGFLWASSSLR